MLLVAVPPHRRWRVETTAETTSVLHKSCEQQKSSEEAERERENAKERERERKNKVLIVFLYSQHYFVLNLLYCVVSVITIM